MTIKHGPYTVVSSRKIYENPWISVREDHVKKPDGSDGLFGVVTMQPGVSVLAVDSRNEAYLVNEYAYALGTNSIEVVSGGIDQGETPLEAAKRELKEESGLEAEEWIDLGTVNPFTSIVESPSYLFLAKKLKEGTRSLENGEFLEVLKVPMEKAVEMVMQSKITHGPSCALILKADKYLRENK